MNILCEIVYCTEVNRNGATLEQRTLVSVRQRQAIKTATGLFTVKLHDGLSTKSNFLLNQIAYI
jgi:hypothetical protein